MVLIQYKKTHLLIIVLVALALNACSHLNSQKQNNRSPNSPIIPVKTNDHSNSISEPKKVPENPSKQNRQPLNGETPQELNENKRSPSDVLEFVIDSAKKAITMKQWLRAQHHLEHALRIAPKEAQIFLLYADVYEGLDIKAQKINMLKRALFLASPGSEVYKRAKEKLAQSSL